MGLLIPPVVTPGSVGSRPQPTIAAVGLRLRPWTFDDVTAVVEAFADPEIQHWHFRQLDPDEAGEWIAQSLDGWAGESKADWAVIDEHDDTEVVGRLALSPVLKDGYGEISYWVVPHRRNQGIATRALVGFTRWAHEELGLHRLSLEHSIHNPGSCRVATKSGFAAEGIRRGANLHDDGWHDMHLHSHLSSDPLV